MLFEFLKNKFGINLKIYYDMGSSEAQDKTVKKILPLLEQMDPFVLNSVYEIAQLSKSSALALAVIFQDGFENENNYLDIHDAVNIARLDEHY